MLYTCKRDNGGLTELSTFSPSSKGPLGVEKSAISLFRIIPVEGETNKEPKLKRRGESPNLITKRLFCFIYIYIERERERDTHTHTRTHTHTHRHTETERYYHNYHGSR